ncbi:MAG: O-antigen ligase family protein [Chloroflexota bacterium]
MTVGSGKLAAGSPSPAHRERGLGGEGILPGLGGEGHPRTLPSTGEGLPGRVSRILGYGLASLPFVGAMIPFAIATGTGSGIVMALLLGIGLLGLWLASLLVSRRVVVVRSAVNAPACVVALIWVIALIWSNIALDPRIAFRLTFSFTIVQIAGTAVTIVSLGLLLVGANVAPRRRYLQIATWSMIAVGTINICAEYAHIEDDVWFLKSNGLFATWVIALAYGQALFNHELPKPVRAALLVLVGAIMFRAAVWQTIWLSGWMPGLAAIGTITLLRSRLLTLIGGVVGLLGSLLYSHKLYEAIYQSQVDEGSDTRFDIWAQAWDLLSKHPVFGTGPAGYAAYYMALYADSLSSMSTHSNYVDIAAQTGIVGAVAFLWLLAAILWMVFKGCLRWRDGLYGAYAAAAMGGFAGAGVAMTLGDWVIPFVYNQGIDGFRYTVHTWAFLGLAAGLAEAPLDTVERT